MIQNLLFGTAYYPEYMPYDRMETDLHFIKDAGMNVIRIAESTWSVLEPSEGIYDFSVIDKVLDTAEQFSLQVIIGTPTYAIPSWLAKKAPDVMVTGRNGRADYGHRQLLNIMNPTYRSCAEQMITKLLTHTAKRKCVIGYQIDNETKHYGNFGAQVQKLFKEHLIKKFETTEAFNKAFYLNYWSNSIADWEDLPDMTGCCNGGLASEFASFQRRLAAEFLSWQAELVKKYKRKDQFITHNLDFEWKKFGADIAQDGYSYGIQPDISHYEAAKCLTIAGTDIYHPTKDCLTGAEIAFGGDEIRCLKNSGYLVLETQAQAFKYWTPYPGQLRLHAYSHLASGAAGLLYWNWHSIHNGYEAYWRGILGHDLKLNPVYREVAAIGQEWRKLEERAVLHRKNNRIALLTSNRSLDALQWFPVDKDLSYNALVRWMYDCLYEINLECDIIDIDAVIDSLKMTEESCPHKGLSEYNGKAACLEQYRMLVTPALYAAPKPLLEILDTFVKNGGVLVSGFRSFIADEYLSIYPDTQPYLLNRCFGIHYQQFTEPGSTRIRGKKVEYFAELLETDTAEVLAMYEHKYWGNYAGITRNIYGTGSAYYIGCFTDKDILKDIFQMAAADAGLKKSAAEGEPIWPVIIRSGENAAHKKVHYILHYDDQERMIPSPYYKAEDILTGAIYQLGDNIALSAWDVKILEEIERS